MSHETVLKLNTIQVDILIAIANLISKREDEDNNNKKTTINAYSIAKQCGRSYNTTKKYLKKMKDL